MSCAISTGRALSCKDSIGGLKAVYFVNYEDIDVADITYDVTNTDVIDTIVSTGSVTAYKYDLKGASTFEQAVTSSRENGTTFFEQTLNLTFTKLDKATHKQLKLIAWGRPRVLVEDYNGNVFLMGLEHGAEVSGGTIVSGAAMGDLSGYTLTLTAQEKAPANFLDGTLASANFAVSATQIQA
jgi:hypothetical protein